jgi:hypothetical protein
MTITRPDINAGLPKRDSPTQRALQMSSGDTLPILKEAFVKLTVGRYPLITWVVANITVEFILELNVMHAHDAICGSEVPRAMAGQ